MSCQIPFPGMPEPTAPVDPDAVSFEAFHQANPQVMTALAQLADRRLQAGQSQVSIWALFGELRERPELLGWVSIRSGRYQLNNNLTPYYARALMALYGRFGDLFEVRKMQLEYEPDVVALRGAGREVA